MVRPDVERGPLRTGALRLRPVGQAEHATHEEERRGRVERRVRRPVGREPACDHEVVPPHGMNRGGDGVHHRAVPTGRDQPPLHLLRGQVPAEVRLVPDHPVADPGQIAENARVAERGGAGKRPERGVLRPVRPVLRAAVRRRPLRPGGRADDVGDRRESQRHGLAHLAVEVRPVVARVVGARRDESLRRRGAGRGDDGPVEHQPNDGRAGAPRVGERRRRVRALERGRVDDGGHEGQRRRVRAARAGRACERGGGEHDEARQDERAHPHEEGEAIPSATRGLRMTSVAAPGAEATTYAAPARSESVVASAASMPTAARAAT